MERLCFRCNTSHPAGQRCPNAQAWGGRRTQAIKHRLLTRDSNACQECGQHVEFRTCHVDHVTPRAMGGSDDLTNLQILCIPCNEAKGNG